MCAWSRKKPGLGPQSDDPAACRDAALRLLERSRRTRADLLRRLGDKGFTAECIEAVIARLAEVGLVDDAEFARAWLAGRWGRRPAGWRRLEQELRARGVESAAIEQARAALAERGAGGDDLATARRVVAQAQRRLASLEPHVRRRRLHALLVRRGFASDLIREVLAGGEGEGRG